jgi:transposase
MSARRAAGRALERGNDDRARDATGKLAKAGRLDAALFARMGAASEMPFQCGGRSSTSMPIGSNILAGLKELYIAREARVKDRTAAKNRAKIRTFALLKRQNVQRLDQINVRSPPSTRPFSPSSKPMRSSPNASPS